MTETQMHEPKIAFCCTSIFLDSEALKHNISTWPNEMVYVALDLKSQENRELGNCQIRVDRQARSEYERACPKNTYSRKNIAFIEASHAGAEYIFETDDDNIIEDWCDIKDPNKIFKKFSGKIFTTNQNIFSKIYLLEDNIWARGYPIRNLDDTDLLNDETTEMASDVGVVQFLVNGNPDVDAIFRLVKGNNVDYRIADKCLPAATVGAYHPFNSQATLWPKDHFPLMYLPSTCSFRMTDIYRGYVAQHILYSLGFCVKYCPPNVYQKRNEHRISSDFFQEYKGYAETQPIIERLSNINLSGMDLSEAMIACYTALGEIGVIENEELRLLQKYLESFG